MISVCDNGYALHNIPDVTRSCGAGQKDTGVVRSVACSTWPRGTPGHGNVSHVSFNVAVSHHRPNFRNATELRNFGLKSALQHRFRPSPQETAGSDSVSHLQGPVDALRELKAAGCHLATKEWVDNHWSLILWKLAGMAALDLESEADVDRRRWCWAETMRQMKYR